MGIGQRNRTAFLLPPNAATLSPCSTQLSTHRAASRRNAAAQRTAPPPMPALPTTTGARNPTSMTSTRPPAKRVNWLRVALLAAGTAVGGGFRMPRSLDDAASTSLLGSHATHAVSTDRASSGTKLAFAESAGRTDNVVSLKQLGIKRDDFLSDRELRRRKTTQFSEAEEEIMELEEWEVSTQWFRDLQMLWAGVASVAGMFVLYKGGVLWENWIKEQEKKDMEEEIELTGTFIDPRAVRKDEDEDDTTPKKAPPKGPGSGPKQGDGGSADGGGPSGGIESLERIFGKS